MDLIGMMVSQRCGICHEAPGWDGGLSRCDSCGAHICPACWRDKPLLSLIASGCRHRRLLPGQGLDIFRIS